MLHWLGTKIFGSKNERVLKQIWPLVERINALESEYKGMSDATLKEQTTKFKQRLAGGESLDDLLPEAFAVVRETSTRVLGMRHFDVQLLGGVVLHQGKIAEMKTGEGKTLCATLPVYLNALAGKGVHVVTVNDYLASRDAEWMGGIYRFLGLTVGVVVESLSAKERYDAYRCDITYGQNNQYGFDYLRDNMKMDSTEIVQREHHYAIVDEVDSILVDEARTPLIISGPSENPTETYGFADKLVRNLIRDNQRIIKDLEVNPLPPEVVGDSDNPQALVELYTVDLKAKQVQLAERGVRWVEKEANIENLFDPANIELLHHVNQALKAHVIMKRDVEYLVRNNQVVIVDEFTGRQMVGRRWSDGLHQAIEAKEGVPIARESETLGTITFQNYFRMYSKLAGMTGTADTEAVEFKKIYNLDVVIMPTNRPMIRADHPDVIYSTERGKYNAVCREIEELHHKGQPMLVGTASIEASEKLSRLLEKRGIPHEVLNAKQHEREAEIVAQSGRFGHVTISTNMAGRGTDIVLGGNPEFLASAEARRDDGTVDDELYQQRFKHFKQQCEEEKKRVLEAGGLHVLGTERHESRRIDNQLRGRSGRQGDPGSSRFYVSLEDELMRRFGGERMRALMTRVGMTEDDALEGRLVAHAIENAQKKVEGFNFDIRKHLLQYDDVLNKQREVIYSLRRKVLLGEEIEGQVLDMIPDVIEEVILARANERNPVLEWDVVGIISEFNRLFGVGLSVEEWKEIQQEDPSKGLAQKIFDTVKEQALVRYQKRKNEIGEETLSKFGRFLFLQSIDHFWKEHLKGIDHLREGISLRAYGQKNPLHEYQREAFELFTAAMFNIKSVVVLNLFTAELLSNEEIHRREEIEKARQKQREAESKTIHEDAASSGRTEGRESGEDGLNRAQRRRREALEKPHSMAGSNPAAPIVSSTHPGQKKAQQRKKQKAAKKSRQKNR